METIGDLMAECEGLTQQIDSEKDRLERFMLETGGASDASDRIQENIDSLKGMLMETENRLQALSDEQEREAFSSMGTAAGGQKTAVGRRSVIKDLAETKEKIATEKPQRSEKGRESMRTGMEK